MPLYDKRCTGCGRIEENIVLPANHAHSCSYCGMPTENVWSVSPRVEIFQAGFFEGAADADGKVPYFDSRQKYKSYLKDHGMYADYVEGR